MRSILRHWMQPPHLAECVHQHWLYLADNLVLLKMSRPFSRCLRRRTFVDHYQQSVVYWCLRQSRKGSTKLIVRSTKLIVRSTKVILRSTKLIVRSTKLSVRSTKLIVRSTKLIVRISKLIVRSTKIIVRNTKLSVRSTNSIVRNTKLIGLAYIRLHSRLDS